MNDSEGTNTTAAFFETLGQLVETIDLKRVGELTRELGFACTDEEQMGIYADLSRELERLVYGLAYFTKDLDSGDVIKAGKSIVAELTGPGAEEFPLSGLSPIIVEGVTTLLATRAPWTRDEYIDVQNKLADGNIDIMFDQQVRTFNTFMSVLPEAAQDLVYMSRYTTRETIDLEMEKYAYLSALPGKTLEQMEKDSQRRRNAFAFNRITDLLRETAETTTKEQIREASRLFAENISLESFDRFVLEATSFAAGFVTAMNFPEGASDRMLFNAEAILKSVGDILTVGWKAMNAAQFPIAARFDEVMMETRSKGLTVRAAEFASAPNRPEPGVMGKEAETAGIGLGSRG